MTGKIVVTLIAPLIGRRMLGVVWGLGGTVALALAGYYNWVFVGGVPLMVVLMCASTFCIEGGFSNLAPYTVESYGVSLGARSSGLGQTANGFGKIIGPLSLALIAGTSHLVSPPQTAAAVFPAFLFLAFCMALVGLSFLFLGVETHGKAMVLDHGTVHCAGSTATTGPLITSTSGRTTSRFENTTRGRELMTTIASTGSGLSDAEHNAQLRRAMVAGTVGTIIEAYDFLLYVQVAPLVFATLFFPGSDRLVGTLQAFGIYAVGFVARPVGAALFGHYGDRIGRKVTLIATLLLTGLSTFAVGFVPGYATIGIWGAVILTVLRFIQGMGIGGEWGGATLIAMEWAKTNKHRGFITSWPQWGGPGGLFFANMAVLAVSWISGD